MKHPDNPTNIEAAAEVFSEAVRLSKTAHKRTATAPWIGSKLTTSVIRELCGEIADLLIDEFKSRQYHD